MLVTPLRRRVAYLLVVAAGPVLAQPSPTVDQAELFESRIRPLLADNCYQCHSGRTSTPFGGLRLDSREGLLAGGDTGPAVVPGDAAASELVERLHGRPMLMPPTGALGEAEIAALVEWIDMGALWPEAAAGAASMPDPSAPFDLEERRQTHWAWQPATRSVPSTVADQEWNRTVVDQFIRSALDREGLAPAAPVGREALIRRLSFDLQGLPPTPAEVARFVSDEAPDAYATLVDQFLASPHFGERWARHWMDLVRYSESHGSEGDPDIPEAWRYRDYLIRAFNADLPYDQLIREHLAGDLLSEPRVDAEAGINESVIGTAHYRLVEHGYQPVDPWEDRVKWVDNQVDVVSKAFLGLTVSCARCHDHKFDAISQKDYYSLFGTLYGARPTQRAIDTPARLATNRDALAESKADIRRRLAGVWLTAIDEVPAVLAERAAEGSGTPESEEVGAREGSVLAVWQALAAEVPDRFVQSWSTLRADWAREIEERKRFNAAEFTPGWDFSGADYADTVGHGTGRPDTPSAPGEFVVERRGDHLLDGIYPGGAYTHLLSDKHAGVIQTPRFTIDQDFISFQILGGNLSFANLIIENYAVPRGGIYENRSSPKRDEMTWVQWDVSFWKGFSAYIEFATQNDVTQFMLDAEDQRETNRPTRRGDGRSAIGVRQVVFHDREATPRSTEVPLLHLLDATDGDEIRTAGELAEAIAASLRAVVTDWRDGVLTERQAAFLDEAVRADLLPRSLETLESLRGRASAHRLLERGVPVARRVPGVVEEGSPDHPLLVRGSHKNFSDPVPRAFLTALDPEPYAAPTQVRLRLAEAITDPSNPLTARVAVNRIWRHLFGYGLVRTVDNFGRLGDAPSHPELLDTLALDFANDGYSVKRLVRRLVSTETYRMSSDASPASLGRDPDNRLLQHANLRRLDAEAIRDSMLAVSGRFDRTLFGPSVPVHYAERHGMTEGDPNNGPVDGNGRRSIYQEIRRNAYNPFLQVFDQPKPSSTRGQRDSTNVPAQSLTLLNSPFVIDQAAEWGRRLAEGEAGTVEGRLDHMYLKTFTRRPSPNERARLVEYLEGAAAERGTSTELLLYDAEVWQDVAHSLFNLKEYLFIR